MNTALPPRRIYQTPRPLLADAYTIGSNTFQSEAAKTSSTYYLTFRRQLHHIDPDLYPKGDDRILFVGLPRILEKLFYDPITHEEIDESIRFLRTAKVGMNGLGPYDFPEKLWRRVVDEFGGRPPIQIKAMPEGSVVYPNEPVLQVRNLVDGFGEFAAWWESKLVQTWAATERVTQSYHWFEQMKQMVRRIEPDLPEDQVAFKAGLMLHDFGDRAGMSLEESNEQGKYHLLIWAGTDTFSGGYQAWKDSGEVPGVAMSVLALAHRNVQSFETEEECYLNMYEKAQPGEILSMVADCYDFYHAVEFYLLPLALRAQKDGSNKVIVARPDSGDALEQVTWVCRLARRNGLCTSRMINGKEWHFGTNLRFIEGDSMDFGMMGKINEALIEQGFPPYAWGLYGVGGNLRNNLKRDNLSAKYALCAVGDKPVVKFSETLGKTTLPGPFKVLRTDLLLLGADSGRNCKTVAFESEPGEDAMVIHFDGTKPQPFGEIMREGFQDVKKRIQSGFSIMPRSLWTEENHGYPASDAVRQKRLELLTKYAPKKRKENY